MVFHHYHHFVEERVHGFARGREQLSSAWLYSFSFRCASTFGPFDPDIGRQILFLVELNPASVSTRSAEANPFLCRLPQNIPHALAGRTNRLELRHMQHLLHRFGPRERVHHIVRIRARAPP